MARSLGTFSACGPSATLQQAMVSFLSDNTSQTLRSYLRETKSTHSEIGKREQFTALLGSLFPNTREVGMYARGSENHSAFSSRIARNAAASIPFTAAR